MQEQKHTQEDEIDLRELFKTIKDGKKIIWGVTGGFVLLALVYVFSATAWWEATATIEIGQKQQDKDIKATYIEDGVVVRERLQVQYIDVVANVKDRDSMIKSVSSSTKNPQFISITALGKDNQLALDELHKVVDKLLLKHSKIIEEITANKKSQLDSIDRSIEQLKNNKIVNIQESIDYITKIQIPSIDKTIASVDSDLQKSKTQRDDALKNLMSIKNEPSLSALRMGQIQNLEYKISNNEIKLIDLNRQKEAITKTTLPAKERELLAVQKIELVALEEKRKLIVLSMESNNYYNSAIVGNIVTKDYPIKPKKKLIIVVAFITGLMFSIFLLFFLSFIKSMREDKE